MQNPWSRRAVLCGLAAGGMMAGDAQAQAPAAAPARITRLDPAFDRLIDADAAVQPLMDGLALSEGPVWIGGADGYLLVSDVPGNVIHRWSAASGAREFLRPSGYAGPKSPALYQAGSNGLIAARGGVVMADSGNRGIARLDLRTRAKTMLCSRFEGRRFNVPNDLVLARDGAIYFSDPTYGLNPGYRELDFTGVFRLAPNGAVTLVDREVGNPNGVGLSPDNRTLYVTEAGKGWLAYDLDASGRATNKRLFIDTAATGVRGGDGFKIDAQGNMWTSSNQGISVFDPQGRQIGIVNLGAARHSNCELGADGHLYVAIGNAVMRLPVKARRLAYGPRRTA